LYENRVRQFFADSIAQAWPWAAMP
jgi:hypothetical protein